MSVQASSRKLLKSAIENLDLLLLVGAAALFTVLGAYGIADVQVLSSVVLGALGLLAASQVRTRRAMQSISEGARNPRIEYFREQPAILRAELANARELTFVGISMTRTIQMAGREIRTALENGGSVRVVLMEPRLELCQLVAEQMSRTRETAEDIKRRIDSTLNDLSRLPQYGDSLQVRTLSFFPRFGANLFDPGTRRAVVYVQHYEYLPPSESAPIIQLRAADTEWHDHFVAEIERLWLSATAA